MGIVLVGGGARSGKSRFALEYTRPRFERRGFVATAQALDAEMAQRIRLHRAERGPDWTTIEEPIEIVDAMTREASRFDVFVVDCLTFWLSNVLLEDKREPRTEIQKLKIWLQRRNNPPIILVTNEVGCGIVPENAMARRYRDLAGEMNQELAAIADEVYWMVFGIPMAVKKS